jgi:hypothetical protein
MHCLTHGFFFLVEVIIELEVLLFPMSNSDDVQ